MNEIALAHIGVGRMLLGDYPEAAQLIGQTSYRPPRVRLVLAMAYGYLGRVAEAKKELAVFEETSTISAEVTLRYMSTYMTQNPELMEAFKVGLSLARGDNPNPKEPAAAS
jgi:hypothetical protein